MPLNGDIDGNLFYFISHFAFCKIPSHVITELQLCSTFAVNMASLQLCSTAVNMAPLASVLSPLQDPQHPALALTLLHITFTPIAPHYIYTSASDVNMASLQLCSTSVNMAFTPVPLLSTWRRSNSAVPLSTWRPLRQCCHHCKIHNILH